MTKKLKNPTLYTLLKGGCKVFFPSGYMLQGDPGTSYIDCNIVDFMGGVEPDGLQTLTREGVDLALKDERKYKRNNPDTP